MKTIVSCSFWPECPLVWFLFLATTLQISRDWERMVVVSRNQSRQNLWMWGLGSEVSSGKLIHRWRPKLGTATKPSSRRRLLQDSGRWTRQCSLFCISVVTFGCPFTFDIFYFCLHCFACSFSEAKLLNYECLIPQCSHSLSYYLPVYLTTWKCEDVAVPCEHILLCHTSSSIYLARPCVTVCQFCDGCFRKNLDDAPFS